MLHFISTFKWIKSLTLKSIFNLYLGLHPTSAGGMTTTRSGPMLSSSSSIYIPVNALQNLRASMPTLATSVGVSQSMPCVSRSTSSLGKSPGQSFLSSVISKPFAGLAGSLSGSSSGIGHSVHGQASSRMIISRKLWRPRSKSQGRSSVSQWTPMVSYALHYVNFNVMKIMIFTINRKSYLVNINCTF